MSDPDREARIVAAAVDEFLAATQDVEARSAWAGIGVLLIKVIEAVPGDLQSETLGKIVDMVMRETGMLAMPVGATESLH